MKQSTTRAIVLKRTNFGEADRILTLLTPDYGKLRLMARGVRKVNSKLAGGIELFSVSFITFIQGRGELGTLISTRLDKHYSYIVADLDRTMLGYELIKQLNRLTEDQLEADYFHLMQNTLAALDDTSISLELIELWFNLQLLKLAGHAPNVATDASGQPLIPGSNYGFDFDRMAFSPSARGRYSANHIKFLRLGLESQTPKVLAQVQGGEALLAALKPLVQTIFKTFFH